MLDQESDERVLEGLLAIVREPGFFSHSNKSTSHARSDSHLKESAMAQPLMKLASYKCPVSQCQNGDCCSKVQLQAVKDLRLNFWGEGTKAPSRAQRAQLLRVILQRFYNAKSESFQFYMDIVFESRKAKV